MPNANKAKARENERKEMNEEKRTIEDEDRYILGQQITYNGGNKCH